ncbi:unnamed protein product [Gongylonema pulchrum]|uniref:PEHE domain-containing protein n=1 Tax=Gongylonema pulchrum TaxID=637853 RepID=A0A183EXN3_9BILA|nr:unnamed protein product [Gongylonema pulchrum]
MPKRKDKPSTSGDTPFQAKGYDELVGKKPKKAKERFETPGFRVVKELTPLRIDPSLLEEDLSEEAYLKRHEKYERQEKAIKKRDRQRQREEEYR